MNQKFQIAVCIYNYGSSIKVLVVIHQKKKTDVIARTIAITILQKLVWTNWTLFNRTLPFFEATKNMENQ